MCIPVVLHTHLSTCIEYIYTSKSTCCSTQLTVKSIPGEAGTTPYYPKRHMTLCFRRVCGKLEISTVQYVCAAFGFCLIDKTLDYKKGDFFAVPSLDMGSFGLLEEPMTP